MAAPRRVVIDLPKLECEADPGCVELPIRQARAQCRHDLAPGQRRRRSTECLHRCDVRRVFLDPNLQTFQVGDIPYQALVVGERNKSSAIIQGAQVP